MKLLTFVNCSSGKETETVLTKRSSFRNRNWIIAIRYDCVCKSVVHRANGRLRFPLELPSSRCFPICQSARPQWVVSQEEALSRALVTGRTLSIKSPCKSPFLCSAAPQLTPTNSWGNINSPEEKKERKRVEPSGQSGTDEQSEEVDEPESWGVHSGILCFPAVPLNLKKWKTISEKYLVPLFDRFCVHTNFMSCSDW